MSPGRFLRSSNSGRYHWILKLLVATEKPGVYVALYFNFERIYNALKSKRPCILLNKNINFKSETESKMEKPTQSFRETDIVLQFIQESQIKSKTVISWSSRKKKAFFVPFILSEGDFLKIFVLSQSMNISVYVMNTPSQYAYFHVSKNITSYIFAACF